MKTYISGKITGLDYEEAYNYFEWAEVYLEKNGHTPVNPMKLEVSIHPSNDEPDWVDYMLTDLDVLMRQCTKIYMLPNWKESKGSCIEHHIAETMNMEIIYGEMNERR